MDTSENYIKMCEKAAEIQEIVKPKHTFSGAFENGDWVFCHTAYCLNNIPLANSSRDDFIWLPRQDQLQEMVPQTGRVAHPPFYYIDDLFRFYFEGDTTGDHYAQQFTTMEQVWLAYVMKKKFSKVWNGEEWVKSY